MNQDRHAQLVAAPCCLVLFASPVIMLTVGAFKTTPFGPSELTFDAFMDVMTKALTYGAVWQTIGLTAVIVVVSIMLAIAFATLTTRTNTLFRRLIPAVMAVVVATPPLFWPFPGDCWGTKSLIQATETLHRKTMDQRVTALAARLTRLADINEIRQLQCNYGYLYDRGLWDAATDLFAENGTIEVGLDGLFCGKERIREYLHSLGAGSGRGAPGRVSVHLQLMPVITLDDEGAGAEGTWREMSMTGGPGQTATWGQGIQENRYIKVDGHWKILSLHCFRHFVVPYQGGWAEHADLINERAEKRIRADVSSTQHYKTWPARLNVPFHFKKRSRKRSTGSHILGPLTANAQESSTAAPLATIEHNIQLLEDVLEIENLQQIFGYYLDKGQWLEAADLFTEDGELTIDSVGSFTGKSGVLAYLSLVGAPGPQQGRLFENMQLQPVVQVSSDGRHAYGRWSLFAQLAEAGVFHEWGTGTYENDYVKQDGVWKLNRLHLRDAVYASYEDGWGSTQQPFSGFERRIVESGCRPDQRVEVERATGRPQPRAALAGAQDYRPTVTAADLEDLENRVGILEDAHIIGETQNIYGYYLDSMDWDGIAGLFDDDGRIEIARRGVYCGKESIRRSLNLYGEPGGEEGNLHNHMQLQPVIHVAADRKSAKLRCRAFSMMGKYRSSGMWMGGVYENEFINVDGEWKFLKDHVINTYFAPYDVGWKDLAQRPVPGVSATNPPDLPPTVEFELYPKNCLVPFHYANPVTGNSASAV